MSSEGVEEGEQGVRRVWDHIAGLLADPALIRAEITKRLAQHRTADPATAQRKRLDTALAESSEAIKRLIGAYQEQLITLDELGARMPELRARETSLRHQLDALDAQLADREVYLQLADNLQDFRVGLRDKAATASVAERQRVLRLLVKDVLVGPDKITIRHSIPVRSNTGNRTQEDTENDSEGEVHPDCQLRWRSQDATLRRAGMRLLVFAEFGKDPGLKQRLDQQQHPLVLDPVSHPVHQGRVVDRVKARLNISIEHPAVTVGAEMVNLGDRVMCAPHRPEPLGDRHEVGLENRFQHQLQRCLNDPVRHGRDTEAADLA